MLCELLNGDSVSSVDFEGGDCWRVCLTACSSVKWGQTAGATDCCLTFRSVPLEISRIWLPKFLQLSQTWWSAESISERSTWQSQTKWIHLVNGTKLLECLQWQSSTCTLQCFRTLHSSTEMITRLVSQLETFLTKLQINNVVYQDDSQQEWVSQRTAVAW